jgi:hypothetical protein
MLSIVSTIKIEGNYLYKVAGELLGKQSIYHPTPQDRYYLKKTSLIIQENLHIDPVSNQIFSYLSTLPGKVSINTLHITSSPVATIATTTTITTTPRGCTSSYCQLGF